eukprot:6189241-Pleurochrysis_carterae.AAC.1
MWARGRKVGGRGGARGGSGGFGARGGGQGSSWRNGGQGSGNASGNGKGSKGGFGGRGAGRGGRGGRGGGDSRPYDPRTPAEKNAEIDRVDAVFGCTPPQVLLMRVAPRRPRQERGKADEVSRPLTSPARDFIRVRLHASLRLRTRLLSCARDRVPLRARNCWRDSVPKRRGVLVIVNANAICITTVRSSV